MGVFRFKNFDVDDSGCGMKICSDSVLLAAWFLPAHRTARTVADIGAGSGVLSLLAADILPDARITAVEIDAAAATAAGANFAASPWGDRLRLEHCDFADFAAVPRTFDVVISNPPYFVEGLRSADAARAAARHQQGLSYSSILKTPMLAPDGHLGLVAPAELEADIIFAAEMAGIKVRRLCRIHTSHSRPATRILLDIARTDGPLEARELFVRDAAGSYTREYRDLVEPYYLYIK